jgi:class 3 adenylate cyclase
MSAKRRRNLGCKPERFEMNVGALLAVDLGNSTSAFFQGKRDWNGAWLLEELIANLCHQVNTHAGSIMSYTGDGLIAMFESAHFSSPEEAAQSALLCACNICKLDLRQKIKIHKKARSSRTAAIPSPVDLTIRAALHWGKFYIPGLGPLRGQIIGEDVVCTTRLCDWLGKVIELAQPPRTRTANIAATRQFTQVVAHQEPAPQWRLWGKADFKGLSQKVDLYLWDRSATETQEIHQT